jgi:hypothetical protein
MFEPAKTPPSEGARLWLIVMVLALGLTMTRSYAVHDRTSLALESFGLGFLVLTMLVPRRLDYGVQDSWLVVHRTLGLPTKRLPIREATVTTVTPVWGPRVRPPFRRSLWQDVDHPRARDGWYRVDGKETQVYASINGPGLLIEAPTFRVFVTPADLDAMRAALEQGGATLA